MSSWYLEIPKQGSPRIRRTMFISGKRATETHPLKNFEHLLKEPKSLQDYVTRLNGHDPRVLKIRKRLEFEHAFIGPEFLEEYQNIFLKSAIPDEKEGKKLVWYLKTYALNYFIGKLNIANPIEWKRNESKWGLSLLNKNPQTIPPVFEDKNMRSAKVLRIIVYELNRFMRFLHTKHPDIPAITFSPLSKAALKEHEARRQLIGEIKKTKYVKPAHWEIIESNLNKPWKPLIQLCYFYGLRRSEAYGLHLSDLKRGYLDVQRQLDKIKLEQRTFKPLKGRIARRTPHWYIEPAKTYQLIKDLSKLTTHPDSITQEFPRFCQRLGLPGYNIHDLRRSFITNSVKQGINQEDLRLAVGHVDGSTTYRYYVIDSREFDNEIFVPQIEKRQTPTKDACLMD